VASAALGFALVAALLTIVPGIDTALIVRSAVIRGRGFAAATALGIQVGCLLWGVAAAAGASALLAASGMAYRVLVYAGAAYLVFLGAQLIIQSLSGGEAGHAPATIGTNRWRGFRMGLTTNLLNPKIGVFYVAAIPQFTPAGVNPLLMGFGLASIHVLFGLAWSGLLIVSATLAGRWLRSSRAARIIDRVTGTVLVGFGLRLASHRP
jgi:threonine/homoserine/homoserine lactone efflux protein